nr:COX15/CtaA family protein [Oceanobacillus halotolerans]
MKKLTFITIVLTYFLIVFGGYVASSESGMGCGPDWPLCNGEVIPELQGETLIEFGHRVIGAILFIFTSIIFWKLKTEDNSKVRHVANWLLTLLIIQLIMGAIVVFYHLPPVIITIHLLIAMIFLALLIWIWRNQSHASSEKSQSLKKHFHFLTLLLIITIGLGAYVKHNHYGLACGWLTCNNSFFPNSISGFFQTIHRYVAFIVSIHIVYITYYVFQNNLSLLKGRMVVATIIIFIQLLIGILTILSNISISYAVIHLAAATLLFAIVIETSFVIRKD